jgi:FlaA1/EpsC-like NDP-sugar epimerase
MMTDRLTHAEEEQLLGRKVEALLTPADRAAFAGRVCLITGAGGTVGAELACQLAQCAPARLVLVEQSEVAIFRLESRLQELAPDTPIDAVLCDVTRAASIARVMRRVRPHVVFHAAAYKHVTMAERAICAAARVNVLGTSAVLAAAREVGARVVLISTDKAAAPHSVMGATKRLAEIVALDAYYDRHRPIVVRFGNVLASSGSFVEVMRERIRDGKAILVTDPAATRFFMTVAEAASLVLKAATLAKGGETYWLDMGPQVRIGDLADRLNAIAAGHGLTPAPIEVIGLRPGEKVVEELASQGIRLEQTSHPRVWVAHQATTRTAAADVSIRSLRRAVTRDDAYGVMTTLTVAIGDFVPSGQAWKVARETRTALPAVVRASRPRPVGKRRDGSAAPAPLPADRPALAARGGTRRAEIIPMATRRAGWLR